MFFCDKILIIYDYWLSLSIFYMGRLYLYLCVRPFVRLLAHNSLPFSVGIHVYMFPISIAVGICCTMKLVARWEKRTQIKINISFSLLLFATWSLHKLPLHCGRTSLAHTRLLSFCYDFVFSFCFYTVCIMLWFLFLLFVRNEEALSSLRFRQRSKKKKKRFRRRRWWWTNERKRARKKKERSNSTECVLQCTGHIS